MIKPRNAANYWGIAYRSKCKYCNVVIGPSSTMFKPIVYGGTTPVIYTPQEFMTKFKKKINDYCIHNLCDYLTTIAFKKDVQSDKITMLKKKCTLYQ